MWGFLSLGKHQSQRSSVCRGLNGCASDCRPFTGKCGNAVLSFPVCNYLKKPRRNKVSQQAPSPPQSSSRGFGLLNAPWQKQECVGFIFCPEIWPQRAASSVYVPSTPPHSWAAVVPPSRPVGRKGGVILTQSGFLKSHLAGSKRNRSSRSGTARLWRHAWLMFKIFSWWSQVIEKEKPDNDGHVPTIFLYWKSEE